MLYEPNMYEVAKLIAATGHETTTLVEGHIGSGKSSLLKLLKEMLSRHTPIYFDCTTKAEGDVALPNFAKLEDDTGYITSVTHEELGLHLKGPIILMIDEYGKAAPPVKLALLRVMLERVFGSYTMHPDSIVFSTTNLGAEGVGDLLPPHARNRMSVVRMAKPSVDMVLAYGVENGWDASLLSWVKDNPHCLQSFTDVKDPQENLYIFHPQAKNRPAFVTARSLELYSRTLKHRDVLGDDLTTAHGVGFIGAPAALDMAAYIKLGDKLPKREQILNDPNGAPVPDNTAALCMVVFRALSSMDREFVEPFMTYLDRLPESAQDLFVNGVRAKNYSKKGIVMTNAKFTAWCKAHDYLFTVDA